MRTKYKNKSCRYGGRMYHSRREVNDAIWLDSLLKQGKIQEVNHQYKISLRVNGEFICNHYVDFEVILNDGRPKYVETKGFPTEVWRLKKKLFNAIYPDAVYLVNPDEATLLK